MPVRAKESSTGISVKKLKPILDLVRGKRVEEMLQLLQFLPSPAADKVSKVIKSAVANAESELQAQRSDLRIVGIYSGPGTSLKRFRARARGRGTRIVKRDSHITVVIDDEEGL